MSHFLQISQFSRHQIEALLQRALMLKQLPVSAFPDYSHHPIALLFYESSTRTRVSFEMAARYLSMPVIHLDLNHSSENKGEIIQDTLKNLAAMGIRHFVIRHKQEGLQQELAQQVGDTIHLVNAGDGTHAHPSQALLDMMTILEQKPCLEQLKIAVLGDVKHSRVANSFQHICATLGVGELVFIAPDKWQPKYMAYGRMTADIQEGLQDADVVMCLRVQKERINECDMLDLNDYKNHFALTAKSLAYARADALVLHPGPVNRGIEIDSDIADGPQSAILKQVSNGIYARMAILESLETVDHSLV